MGTRKSSGTIIVPREHPRLELKEGDEVFDADDARAMSPRRSSQDLEKMGQEARAQLNEYAPRSPLPAAFVNPHFFPGTQKFYRSLSSRSSTVSRR
jgi:hypothetical protein